MPTQKINPKTTEKIDLVSEGPKGQRWAVEIKKSLSPRVSCRFIKEGKLLGLMHEKAYAAQRVEKIKEAQALYDISQKTQGTAVETYLQGRGISQKTLE